MMAVVSDITYLLGGQPAYATGYAFTMAWYYSRALQEHTDQDVQIPGWRNYVVLYWDAWRSSKFVFAFAPATIVLLLCIYGGAVT